jgi:hypothetical protein
MTSPRILIALLAVALTAGSAAAESAAAPASPSAPVPAAAPATPPGPTVPPGTVPGPAAPPAPAAAIAAPTTPVVAPPPPHAPIVVAVVVDQLAAWVLRERIDRLPSDGGFARLRREGKYFPEVAFAHAITETSPGHAALFTGKVPRENGVVANDVLGPDGKPQPFVADDADASKPIGLDGRSLPGPGSSVDALEGKSNLVAAAFRSRYPKGQGIVAAFSLKDRGALFAAGESGDYAVWFDPKLGGEPEAQKERGGFVTTLRYQAGLAKSGLAALLASHASSGTDDPRDGIVRIEQQPWTGLDPAWLAENAGVPGSSDYTGFVAAHTASQAVKPGAAFRALPATDRLLMTMALQILKTEPRGLPVFLTLSLSANDYVGHLFGPDSWEAWDELRRLDAALAWFFRELDAFGRDSWAAVLTADHGVAPLEDSPKRPACAALPRAALDSAGPCSGQAARGARIHLEDFRHEAENAAAKAGLRGAGGARIDAIIAGVVWPYVYLTEAAKTALASDRTARTRLASRLDNELRQKFKSVHAILDVAPWKDETDCPDEARDRLGALVCNSVSPASERAGDFYIVLKPGAFFDPDLIKGAGAAHGSPYGYDRIVPMLVRDPQRPELAGQVEVKRTPFSQFHDELVRIILSAPSFAR